MELLSPVGSKDSLIAAVENGADAVYLGGNLFNARRYAANFTDTDIEWAIDYCHIRGVKVYVTVNILIHQHEIDEVLNYLMKLVNMSVDAVIVQDLGLAHLISQVFPELEMHASTQLFIHNPLAIKYNKQLGFTRVVLPRELHINQINELSKTGIELEVFVHGAICICYSGQCLFSSLLGDRSGNRGQCAQPCRLTYQLVDFDTKKEIGNQLGEYLLSPKDLNLIEHLDLLEKNNVTSLKIEGRMKNPDYVAVVTQTYRKILDRQPVDKDALLAVFNRGFTNHQLLGKQSRNLIRWEPEPYESDDKIIAAAHQTYSSPKVMREVSGDLFAKVKLNHPLELTFIDQDGIVASATSEKLVETAIYHSLTSEKLHEQLLRFGNTAIDISSLEIELDADVIIPVSQINRTRQQLVHNWEENRIQHAAKAKVSYDEFIKRKKKAYHPTLTQNAPDTKTQLAVSVTDPEAAYAAMDAGADIIYYYGDIYQHGANPMAQLSALTNKAREQGSQMIVSFERVTSAPEFPVIEKTLANYEYDGVLVGNLGMWELLKSRYSGVEVHGDWSLNVFNSVSANYLYDQGMHSIFLSPELTLAQIKNLAGKTTGTIGTIVHGKLPVMVSEYCPVAACMSCTRDGGKQKLPCRQAQYGLKDRKDYVLPLRMDHNCRMHLYNPIDLCLLDHLGNIIDAGVSVVRIEAKAEDANWVSAVVGAYTKKLVGDKITQADLLMYSDTGNYTKGHYFRGVK